MKKSIFSILILLLMAQNASAQGVKGLLDQDFDDFNKEIVSDYQKFRDQINAEYAKFMEEVWKSYPIKEAEKVPEEKKL